MSQCWSLLDLVTVRRLSDTVKPEEVRSGWNSTAPAWYTEGGGGEVGNMKEREENANALILFRTRSSDKP